MEAIYATNINLHTQVCNKNMRTVESIMENGLYSIWKKNLYKINAYNDKLLPTKTISSKYNAYFNQPISPCRYPSFVCDMV